MLKNEYMSFLYKGIIAFVLISIGSFFFNVPMEYVIQKMHYVLIGIFVLLLILLFCIRMLEESEKIKNKKEEK